MALNNAYFYVNGLFFTSTDAVVNMTFIDVTDHGYLEVTAGRSCIAGANLNNSYTISLSLSPTLSLSHLGTEIVTGPLCSNFASSIIAAPWNSTTVGIANNMCVKTITLLTSSVSSTAVHQIAFVSFQSCDSSDAIDLVPVWLTGGIGIGVLVAIGIAGYVATVRYMT